MNQIISGIDYRIVNFMANNGRKQIRKREQGC